MTRRTFVFDPANPQREGVLAFLCDVVRKWGGKAVITVSDPTRTLESNAAMWCLLADIAGQVGWRRARWRGDRCVEDGRYVLLRDYPDAVRLSDEEFKDVITAALKKPRQFGGIDGGVVAVGLRTSKMTQGEMRDLLVLIEMFGASVGVTWTPVPAKDMAA